MSNEKPKNRFPFFQIKEVEHLNEEGKPGITGPKCATHNEAQKCKNGCSCYSDYGCDLECGDDKALDQTSQNENAPKFKL